MTGSLTHCTMGKKLIKEPLTAACMLIDTCVSHNGLDGCEYQCLGLCECVCEYVLV